MKALNLYIVIILVFNFFTPLQSQTRIEPDKACINCDTPEPSAVLEIESVDKGILVPRMTSSQRTLIVSPSNGLLVFDETTSSFWFYLSADGWVELKSGNISQISDKDGDTKIQTEETADDDLIRFDVGGTERWVMRGTRLEPLNNGGSIFMGFNAGMNDDLSDNRNVAIGAQAMLNNTTGRFNTAIGYQVLLDNVTGLNNDAFGYRALYNNTSGNWNSAIGFQALYSNTTGNYNVALGNNSLHTNTSGLRNTALGYQTIFSNLSGSGNAALGYKALYLNTSGGGNTAVGGEALYSNTTGIENSSFGTSSLKNNLTGTRNTASGGFSLFSNISGSLNVAIGTEALFNNVERSNLVAVGDYALYHNGIGVTYPNQASENTAIGSKAMYSNTTGFYNTALGFKALYSNVSGQTNTAIGNQSLLSNTSGNSNTSIGFHSLKFNTSGSSNVAIGNQSLKENTTGGSNTAIGNRAMSFTTIGYHNTSIGSQALTKNISGTYNISIGSNSLFNHKSGSNNIAIGYQALNSDTASTANIAIGTAAGFNNILGFRNTFIGNSVAYYHKEGANNAAVGSSAMFSDSTGFRNTAIGASSLFNNKTGAYRTALGFSSNSVGTVYNNSSGIGTDSDCTASNQVRIGNNAVTSIGGYANWTNVSDKRFKKNIKENVRGLEFINHLRPVTYTLNQRAIEKFFLDHYNEKKDTLKWKEKYYGSNSVRTGFIAQEVESAALALDYDFSGIDKPKNNNDFYGLRYAEFTVPLVKAVQELDEKNNVLEEEKEALKNQMNEIQEEFSKLQLLVMEMKNCCVLNEKLSEESINIELKDNHDKSEAYIEQNNPNPFYENTVIKYFLPKNFGKAQISFSDLNGQILKTIHLQNDGLGTISLSARELAAGTYTYTLILDGRIIDTKKMVLTR